MPGKRREYDGAFSMTEVNFILDNPDMQYIPDKAFRLYIVLWNLAVRERRETIPPKYLPIDTKRKVGLNCDYLATKINCKPQFLFKYVTNLERIGYIKVTKKKTGIAITVYGVKKLHPNLTWKNDPLNELNRVTLEEEEEKEKEKEKAKRLFHNLNKKDKETQEPLTKSIGEVIDGNV